MKRILAVAITFLLAAALHAESLRGMWTASTWSVKDIERIQLNMNREHSNWGQDFKISAFEGLSRAQITSASDAPVKFALRRDAGTISFDGSFRDGEGAGHFTFTPNETYLGTLRSMHISLDDDSERGRTEGEELYRLTMFDVSLDFIRQMRELGYEVGVRDLVRFRIHGVSPEMVRELRSLGLDHVPAEDLVRMRIHGATPEFIRAMADSGYRNLTTESLVRFRIHGVTPEFVRDIAALGYRDVPGDDLVRMRIHGVTPEFIRDVESAGYRNVPVEKLIQMKIHGIDGAYLKAMAH
ncbi:MAG TPA: hypothetical protein VGJ82_11585 [Thermoanaerobaculia bacterium]|jgi:hypothetical protein